MLDVGNRDHMLILIVEDNELSAKLFVDMLQAVRPDFRVECFECPEAGFEFAKQHHPDLIQLDCQLPYFSGFDFITWCRAVPTLANIPTLMITAQPKFNFDVRAPDRPNDPRYFGLPRHALAQSNTQLCLADSNGVASCPRPDRVYYKPVLPGEYVGIIDEMIVSPKDPVRPARRPSLTPASEIPVALCAQERAHHFRWRRGRLLG
jgi:CheY-like chemotaxis protein